MAEEKKELSLIAKRFITLEGKFKLGEFLDYYEVHNKSLNNRITALEEAVAFFAKWWDENYNPEKKGKVNLLVPEHLKNG